MLPRDQNPHGTEIIVCSRAQQTKRSRQQSPGLFLSEVVHEESEPDSPTVAATRSDPRE